MSPKEIKTFIESVKPNFREHKRVTYDSIQNFGVWQALVLVFVGFIGGIFTGVAGSGTDICSFAILSLLFRFILFQCLFEFITLFWFVLRTIFFWMFDKWFCVFRISEKISTPTSVILMAINTVTGNREIHLSDKSMFDEYLLERISSKLLFLN